MCRDVTYVTDGFNPSMMKHEKMDGRLSYVRVTPARRCDLLLPSEGVKTMDLISKSDWAQYLNRVTRSLEGLRAEVEVASLDLGAQIAAEHLAIFGIFYDHKDDAVGVVLDGLEHLIRNPEAIYVENGDDGLTALAVTDRDGTNHLVKLSRPLALPAPSTE